MKRSELFVSVVFILSAVPAVLVSAQTDVSLSDVGTYSVDARTARIAALREQYRIKLSDKERELVMTRCEPAQTSLQKIAFRLNETRIARTGTYDDVIGSLDTVRTLIVAKQIDPSNIELLTVEYQLKKATFEIAVSDYQTALEDSIQVDCKAQPEDFRAALEGVRSARKDVVNSSAQITELTNSNLKTAFDTLKLKLGTGDGVVDGK